MTDASVSIQELTEQLTGAHGYLMTTAEVAKVLRLDSVQALRMQIRRGQIPLAPVAGQAARRTQVYATSDVARLLAAWLSCPRPSPEVLGADA